MSVVCSSESEELKEALVNSKRWESELHASSKSEKPRCPQNRLSINLGPFFPTWGNGEDLLLAHSCDTFWTGVCGNHKFVDSFVLRPCPSASEGVSGLRPKTWQNKRLGEYRSRRLPWKQERNCQKIGNKAQKQGRRGIPQILANLLGRLKPIFFYFSFPISFGQEA